MTTALLADDEPVLLAELQALLKDAWPDLEIVARAHNGTQARRLLAEHRPDLAFLDIRMPGIDGLALAGLVPAGTQIVFVTAHAEHALDAFECAAVDYLRKPVTPSRLALTVQRLQGRLLEAPTTRQGPRFLQAWVGSNLRLIERDQIACLRSELRHTRVTSFEGQSLLLRVPLGELLSQLDPALFWQVHRGVAINARAIERVERRDEGDWLVHLRGISEAMPVGRSYRGRFKGM
jgi:DNA-binding LytR/AlgR family response regulator